MRIDYVEAASANLLKRIYAYMWMRELNEIPDVPTSVAVFAHVMCTMRAQ